jgi:hypothetical protein
MLVAAVDWELCENLAILPSPDVEEEAVVFDRLTMERERRLATEPPKMSPLLDPGRALKRLREMASRPKIAARERVLALGVAGAELLSVRNLNRPY